jgi:hypothetical protein
MAMKRRDFIAALGAAAAWPRVTCGQQGGVRRVGFLSLGLPSDPFGKDIFWRSRKGSVRWAEKKA